MTLIGAPTVAATPRRAEIPHGLTERWTRLDAPSEGQMRFWRSSKRIIVVPVGRRSGKTEIAKRKVCMSAMDFAMEREDISNGRFLFSAPTQPQANEIFWDDSKFMVPDGFQAKPPNETSRTVHLIGGVKVQTRGLDKAPRIEGSPIDGIALDEYGNLKKSVWEMSVRAALGTRGRSGFAIITGVPRGGIHGPFAKLVNAVQSGEIPDAEVIRWPVEEIVPKQELDAARRTLDPKIYAQEYNAQFTDFGDRACYGFERSRNVAQLEYDPRLPLIFCFDFNRRPGIAVVCQEQTRETLDGKQRYSALNIPSEVPEAFTAVIGQVWIAQSTTPAVCKQLMKDWAHHRGKVLLYGDLTGGARSRVDERGSSDWDVILDRFRDMRDWDVRDMRHRVGTGKANPPVESRMNALNARCYNAAYEVRLLVDAREGKADKVAMDLEGSLLVEGSGELDKDTNPQLTHMLDALGYYVSAEHPIEKNSMTLTNMRH